MSTATLGLRPAVPAAGSDRVLFAAVVALAVVGLAVVYSSSAAVSLDRFGNAHHYVLRHLAQLGIGAALLAGLWRLDYRALDRSVVVHGAWLLVSALLVLALFEEPVAGARRWLRLGDASFQPSELAKVAAVLVCAFQLSRRRDRLGDPWRGVVPPLLLVGQLAVLVALQRDFGGSALLFMLFALLAFVAGTPLRILGVLATGGATLLLAYLVQEPYRLVRLRSFLDPEADPLGAGFQLRQSLIALGTGGLAGRSHEGLLGTGLGTSLQKLFFLPEPHTDFAFAVLGEELGLLGTLTVLGLFAVVIVRGLQAAARAGDSFGALLAVGATFVIGLQALLNMMVVTGLVPTKGLALPFLSVGGSALVSACAAAGLLLSVSRHAAPAARARARAR
jgi:cell division protein FtsW